MNIVAEIEQSVRTLSADELATFRAWFAEYDADAWDRQIEADAATGRLDALAEEGLADQRAGQCTERHDSFLGLRSHLMPPGR